jgi:phage/plasmid primase-like uncharacterized protein
MTRKFPCPYCKGKGGYRGSSDLGGKLEPDEPCFACGSVSGDGDGMISVGSPEHRRLKEIRDQINGVAPSTGGAGEEQG